MAAERYRTIERARHRHGLDPSIAKAPAGASIKAYRVKGGAVVTVTRPDGRRRRYSVSQQRFLALRSRFNASNWTGSYLKASLDVQCRAGSRYDGDQVISWEQCAWRP